MAEPRRTTRAQSGSSTTSSSGYTYYNKTFDDITDLFLFACAHGDYMLAHRLLQEGKAKADVCNRMGKSALQLSIENEHFEVVKVLLDTIPYEQFRDALLLAIYLDHIVIADYILNHPTYRTFSGGFLDPTSPQAYDGSQFSSDITPLILAAQHNRLLIVHQLLSKGERIEKPHDHICSCPECVQSSALDSFRQAQTRLSKYRGLSSEIYVALAYPDPILQAFELGHELRTLAKVERYFGQDYKKLANQLSIFVARLLDNVRGYEELEIVLNKTGLPHQEKYASLARFDLAIQYREKPFVSHSNCQQKLMEIWYTNLAIIKHSPAFQRTVFYLGYILCFPFFALTYYMFPRSKIGSLCQQPNLKFKAYIVSYFLFIGLILFSSYFSSLHLQKTAFLSTYDLTTYRNYIRLIYGNVQLKNNLIGSNGNTTIDSVVNCDISLRFMWPNAFQIVTFIWILGFVWNEFKQIKSVYFHVYLKVPSNYVDCSMAILYMFHFLFLFTSMIYTRLSMNTFQSANYWTDIARYDTMSETGKASYISKTRHILYWLNADRFYWNSGDVYDVSEAFFAMGAVVSICRICFLLPISAFVGPLQVMLDRMMVDISKWIFIIFIFFIAFSCSLFYIYSYFAVTLEQQNTVAQLSSGMNSSTSSVESGSSTAGSNPQCPDYFYQLINQTIPSTTSNNNDASSDNSSDTALTFCEQASNYATYQQVGPYPAIYYFGQSIQATILTTFFTLFGVIAQNGIPDDGTELITHTCYKPDPTTYSPGFDTFSAGLGFTVYGLFTFTCVTVLINTLIAMLERTIEDIDDRADIEWKFARSKLYMEYIREGNNLPVPLNIFPSPRSISQFLKHVTQMIVLRKCSWNTETDDSNEIQTNQFMHMSIIRADQLKNGKNLHRKVSLIPNDQLTYKIVIERIVRRFLLYYKGSHKTTAELKESFQFKEVKNDIASFRFEIAHQIDLLYEMRIAILQSMNKFNQHLKDVFDFEQIKSQLNL